MDFQRTIYKNLEGDLKNNKVCVIFGARQTGKSHLMNKLYKKNKDKAVFFDLEQPEIISQFTQSDSQIKTLLTESSEIVFIDEFHYIENASHIFKAIYDQGKRDPKQKVKIIASGSSAIEMHKHLKESMAGRTSRFYLRPMTLEEYINNKISEPDEYFIYGGLPELYTLERSQRPTLLNEIVSAYIQKDIKSLIKETNIGAFNRLIIMLAHLEQAVAVSNLSRELGLSMHIVQNYLDILEQTFVLYSLHSYSNNLSNELKKSKKYYLYDLGIRNSLLKNFQNIKTRKDQGIIYESYVMQYLTSIIDKSIADLYFWRTTKKDEVDFIWKQEQLLIPIEVKTNIERGEIPDGLKKFISNYPIVPFGVVIYARSKNLENMDLAEYKGKQIYYIDIKKLEYIKELIKTP